MANMIARLGVLLGIDSAEFTRGIEGASRKLEEFGNAAEKYGKIAASALIASSLAAIKFADDIADVAKANDVAIDSIIKLREALAQNGGEAENASKLLSNFNNFVVKAADGSFEAQRSFKSLGISLGDIASLSIDELFAKTAEGLAKIEDPVMRNARGYEIFGKAVRGVDLIGLNENLKETNKLAEEQAEAIKYAADQYDKITKNGRNFLLMLAIELGGPLQTTVQYMQDLNSETKLFQKIFDQTFKGIAAVIMSAAFAAERFRDALFGEEGYSERSAKKYEDLKRTLANLYKEDLRMGMDDPRVKALQATLPKTNEKLRQTKEGINPEDERIARENRRAMDALMMEYAQRQKNNKTYEERQYLANSILEKEQEIFKINLNSKYLRQEDNTLATEILRIETQRKDNIHKLQLDMDLFNSDRQARIEKENELAEKAIELAKERNRLAKEARDGDMLKGATDKMYEYVNSMKTQMELGADMFSSLMSNMESALDRFVQTGKLSFKDLARSIIQDMIRIQMRAQMMSIFKGLFGFGVGGVRGPDNIDVGGGWNPARADGGSVDANKIGLVGERGPELFVPRTAGTIIPNNQLAGALEGQTNVTNNYINAIDTKSFEQRLLESSNTIWAGYTYANKTLASNGRRA